MLPRPRSREHCPRAADPGRAVRHTDRTRGPIYKTGRTMFRCARDANTRTNRDLFPANRERLCCATTRAAPSIEGFAAAIAFDIHFQDRGMMHETVDCRERHGMVGEEFAPFAERLVGRYQHGSP